MKRQNYITTAVMVATLAGALVAQADPVLIVSDGVTSSGPITLTGGSGVFSSATFDSSWTVVVTAGESKPVIGSATNPNMELDIQATSLGSANPLTIILSDNNFGPTSGNNNAVAQLFGQPVGSGSASDVIFNTYYDANNDLAGLSNLLTSSGTVFPSGGVYTSDETNSLSLSAPYSLTEVVQIDGNTAASYSLLANVQLTNETCNCSLSFGNVPTNLTVCQPMCQSSYQPYCQSSYQPYCLSSYQQYCLSLQQYCQTSGQKSQIPNPVYEAALITATDSCLGSVPVQFLGAVTNQMCPTYGFCFITNGTCFFPNGICCPTNGLCFPRCGICFITNGICCSAHNCSLDFQNCSLNGGNCFPSYNTCFPSYGCSYPSFGCYGSSYGSCSQSFGSCFGTYGNNCLGTCGNNCYGTYGNNCSQSCSMSNQCSTVITFTFGATNGCGLLQTVTQTITVEHCQPCFKVGCSQPPQVCYPQPPQNCYPQQSCYPWRNCYQPPQYCYPQQSCYPPRNQNCYPQQQYCGFYGH